MFAYFQLFIYFFIISSWGASNTEKVQSKDDWNEYLELNCIQCGRSLRELLLLLVPNQLGKNNWFVDR